MNPIHVALVLIVLAIIAIAYRLYEYNRAVKRCIAMGEEAANRGAGRINRLKTPPCSYLAPPRYTRPAIQRAWLSGVTGVDITRLTHDLGTVTAEFTHNGQKRIARVHPLLPGHDDVMERVIEDIIGATR